jgi:O-methyltransferase involved in polyketide biosynthesis
LLSETLFIPLVARALDSRRADALIRDPIARTIVESLGVVCGKSTPSAEDRVMICLRALRFDQQARAFLTACPSGTIVEIGCGLDTRVSRVVHGRVQWFDLDLTEAIDLRRRFIARSDRCRHIAGSVLSQALVEAVARSGGPHLFVAEGVLPYFRVEDVRRCVAVLRGSLPGCELVFDGMSPLLLRLHNLQLIARRMPARLRWAMRSPRDLEAWGDDIRLLEDWYYFTDRHPRLGRAMWMGRVPFLGRASGIYRYRLGDLPP